MYVPGWTTTSMRPMWNDIPAGQPLRRLLTGDVHRDRRPRQPGIGGHLMLDRMAQIDVSQHHALDCRARCRRERPSAITAQPGVQAKAHAEEAHSAAHRQPAQHPPMTMNRSAPGPSVGRLSGRNDAQQRNVTPTNEGYFRWSTTLSGL